MVVPSRNAHLQAILGVSVLESIQSLKVLVIGAGGIGCELLKNLVLSGVDDITVVDLDTIDITNLNRQFLFRRQHVSQPKSYIAADAVKGFNPNIKITPHLGNVFNAEFGPQFMQQFDLVINALDNFKARQHVNRQCINVGVPLIEGGSTGWEGQVQVILPGESECLECRPPPVNPTFPVCTIRSTPEKPEHCVAWAKLVHDAVLAQPGGEEANDIAPGLDGALAAALDGEVASGSFVKQVITSLFIDAMEERIKSAHDAKENGDEDAASMKVPRALERESTLASVDEYLHDALKASNSGDISRLFADLNAPQAAPLTPQSALSLVVKGLIGLFSARRSSSEGVEEAVSCTFTKDSPLSVDFVAGAASLRSWCFDIDTKSRFGLQSIAGSIVPAIASTNAIVAGMQTCQLLNLLLARKFKKQTQFACVSHVSSSQPKNVWLVTSNPDLVTLVPPATDATHHEGGATQAWLCEKPRQFALMPVTLEKPGTICSACSDGQVTVEVGSLEDVQLASLIQLVALPASLSSPTVEVNGALVYDHATAEDVREMEEEGETPDSGDLMLAGRRSLASLNLVSGGVLNFMDDSDDAAGDGVRVLVLVRERLHEELGVQPSEALRITGCRVQKRAPQVGEKRGRLGVNEAQEALLDERQDRKRGKFAEGTILNLDDE